VRRKFSANNEANVEFMEANDNFWKEGKTFRVFAWRNHLWPNKEEIHRRNIKMSH
jgi:hypothetical protein